MTLGQGHEDGVGLGTIQLHNILAYKIHLAFCLQWADVGKLSRELFLYIDTLLLLCFSERVTIHFQFIPTRNKRP